MQSQTIQQNQPFKGFKERIPQKILDFLVNPNRYYLFYILILLLITAYYFFRLPIIAGDTDLWYHLNSGRYIFNNISLPDNSYFSFIAPAREWIDYYWLFQVLVYRIYSFFDYYGLVILRAIVYLATVSLILCYILKGQKNYKSLSFLTIIFTLYLLLLIQRYLLVRPHIFTYLFIATFLYILEFKPKKTKYLPLLAILWTNLHGVVYPVLILITLSYIIEFFIKRIKNKTPFKREELSYIIPVVLSMGAVYLTPHGIKLIEIPFTSTEYASHYINELRQLNLDILSSFEITTIAPSFMTVFNVLLLIAFLTVLTALFKRSIRLSHLLMFIGGIVLLSKGLRFLSEFALLVMPVLTANTLIASGNHSRKISKSVHIVLAVLLMVMPFIFLKNLFANQSRYPFSQRNLPHGVSIFLNKIEASGSILNYPNNGGYLQWMLYPKYKIFMDMEVPFLFKDEDFYTAVNAFFNDEVLRKFLSKYDPSFITVPASNIVFKELIKKYPDYIVVFFDDSEVLYVNKKHYPDIAKKYALKMIDPFTLIGKDISLLNEEEKESLLKELLTLTEIYPDSGLTNQIIAMIYNKEGNYNKALKYADKLIKIYPELPKGYRLKGDTFMGQKLFDKAVPYYNTALKKTGEAESSSLYKKLWFCYTNLKQHKKAYDALKKATEIFSVTTSYVDLYNLGLSALQAGETSEALMLFKFAYLKVPPDDTEWKEKIEEQLARFEIQTEELNKFLLKNN